MTDRSNTDLPPYTVRTSGRAKYLRLVVSAVDGVVVVIPKGYDRRHIPAVLEQRRSWLQKHVARLQGQSAFPRATEDLPESITLEAIGQRWTVAYQPSASATVNLAIPSDRHLLVRGAIHDRRACRHALRRWLAQQAGVHLVPWLRRLSEQARLPFAGVTVRGQKTRWGSCSRQRRININFKLLFLPAASVRYVLLHELCHTVVFNHSPHFWAKVAALEPDYRALHAAVRQAWRAVPAWVEQC